MNNYTCSECCKILSSRQNLWRHRKKFHKEKFDIVCCNYCKIILSRKNNLKRHEMICKMKKIKIKEIETNEFKKNIEIEKEKIKIEKEKIKIEKEKMKIEKGKIEIELLKNKLVKQNINNGTINNNINTNSNNTTTTNNTINNNFLVKFGKVKINEILTKKQILEILRKPNMMMEECVKFIHCNDDLPEYKNIRIKNKRIDVAHIYNGKNYESCKKRFTTLEMMENIKDQIEDIVEENKEFLTKDRIKRVENCIDLLNDTKQEFTDDKKVVHENYMTYKAPEVEEIIYNDTKKDLRNLKGLKIAPIY